MNEGEIRFVVRAYNHEGKFIDSYDFIATSEHDIYEQEESISDFMECVIVEHEG